MGGLLYLVLGFAVQHICGGDSLDGQDDVTGAQVGHGGLAAGSDLEESGAGDQRGTRREVGRAKGDCIEMAARDGGGGRGVEG